MKRRLLIVTEIISPYRIPVFNAVARRDDVELHIVFLAETDPTLRKWLVYKHEIEFDYEVLPSWRRRIADYPLLVNRGMGKALARWRPDVIVCGGYNFLAFWQANLWARRHRVGFALWCESTLKDRRNRHLIVEQLKRMFLTRCDAFLVAGVASRAYLRAYGVRDDQIVTAPNAIDTRIFQDGAREARRDGPARRKAAGLPSRYFVYVGRMVKEKGIFELLDAYASLDEALRSRVGLVAVGDGQAKSEFVRRAKSIVPGTVFCPGFVHRDELASYYAFADALVFPTETDPWGMVVNEAMACGLPIIATDAAGATADLVRERENGFVISPRDIDGMTRAMTMVATDEDMARSMGARSADMIQEYSPEACAAGFGLVARSVAVDNPSRPRSSWARWR